LPLQDHGWNWTRPASRLGVDEKEYLHLWIEILNDSPVELFETVQNQLKITSVNSLPSILKFSFVKMAQKCHQIQNCKTFGMRNPFLRIAALEDC